MKNHSLAEIKTSELRDAFVSCTTLLRKVDARYSFHKHSAAVKCDLWLQRFCNELRGLAYVADQLQVPAATTPPEVSPEWKRLEEFAVRGEQCGCRNCLHCSAYHVVYNKSQFFL